MFRVEQKRSMTVYVRSRWFPIFYSTSNGEFDFHFDTIKHISVVDEIIERNRQKKKNKKKIDWKAVLFKKRNMGVFVYIFPDGCPFSFSFLLCLLIGAWRHWKEASPRRWLLWWEVVVLLRPIQSSLGRALKRNGSMMHDHFPPFFSFFGVPASNSNLKQSRKKRE